MVTEAGADAVRYWIPLDPSALVRANVEIGDGAHAPHLERLPDLYVTQHLPFFPEGEIEFVRREGTGAGRFRYGRAPEDPLTRIDR